jgi:hypothetical protein
MKFLLITALFLITSNTYAALNEVECEGTSANKNVFLEIEQSFPSSNVFKSAQLSVNEQTFQYQVTFNNYRGFNQLNYQGSGLRLEVDLWPDSYPRWGSTYQATLNSPDLNHGPRLTLNCLFPNAN